MPARLPVAHPLLVVKKGNSAAEAACERITAWLAGQGVPARCLAHPAENLADALQPDTDFILVLGGDGTMVSMARQSLGLGIPIAGINYGRVGFLTELSDDDWLPNLAAILRHGVHTESRMSLSYSLFRNDAPVWQGEVVNDAVVTRGKVARLVKLHLEVDGAPFMNLRSDGLIFSTPTGSSGYAGSAGGPLIFPTLNAYVVAAICPYLSSFPPMALCPETAFSVVVGEAAPDLYLTLDGQEAHALEEGDRLEVTGRTNRILMADLGLKGYFTRLRQAGFVLESRTVG